MAETLTRPSREDLQELGAPGTTIYAGLITGEEYNADLRGAKALEVYDRMRRSDGQVRAILQALKLPILGAEWKIDPPETPTPEEQEIARWVDQSRQGMSICWGDVLRQALLMLDFGFALFEIVYQRGPDGRIRWRKLAPRLPRTVWRWNVERDGGLRSVTQFVFVPDGLGSGSWEYPEIPVDRLLRFTLDQEGANYEGISALRPAYKNWYLKDQLYRIDAIKHERWGVGIPFVKLPAGFTPADKALAVEIAESLRAHEKAYVVYPDPYEVGLLGMEGAKAGTDALPSIKHHDEMIARSVLAMFLTLGTTETGARALGESFQNLFVMSLEAMVGIIEDTFNRFAIPRLVGLNWTLPSDRVPRLRGALKRTDIERSMNSAAQLAGASLLTWDPELEAHLRKLLNYPPRPQRQPGPGAPPNAKMADPPYSSRFNRAPFAWEACVALEEVDGFLDDAEAELLRRVSPIRQRMVADLIEQLTEASVAGIPEVRAHFTGKLAAIIRDLLGEVAERGRREVRSELERQVITPAESVTLQEEGRPRFGKGELQELWKRIFALEGEVTQAQLRGLLREWFGAKGSYIARKMADTMEGFFIDEALRQRRAGLVGEAFRQALERADAELVGQGLRASASVAVHDSFGLGRLAEATDQADVIEKEYYSAILDRKTCEVCRPLDGREGPVGTFVTPNPDCLGGDRCRCITVYVRRSGAIPEAA